MENMCQEVFAVFAKYFSVYAALSNGHSYSNDGMEVKSNLLSIEGGEWTSRGGIKVTASDNKSIEGVDYNINNTATFKAEQNIEFKGFGLLQNGELHTNADLIFHLTKFTLQKNVTCIGDFNCDDLKGEYIQAIGANVTVGKNFTLKAKADSEIKGKVESNGKMLIEVVETGTKLETSDDLTSHSTEDMEIKVARLITSGGAWDAPKAGIKITSSLLKIPGVDYTIENSAKIDAAKKIEVTGHSLWQKAKLHTNSDFDCQLEGKFTQEKDADISACETLTIKAKADSKSDSKIESNGKMTIDIEGDTTKFETSKAIICNSKEGMGVKVARLVTTGGEWTSEGEIKITSSLLKIPGVDYTIENSAKFEATKKIEIAGHSLWQKAKLHTNSNFECQLEGKFTQEKDADVSACGTLTIKAKTDSEIKGKVESNGKMLIEVVGIGTKLETSNDLTSHSTEGMEIKVTRLVTSGGEWQSHHSSILITASEEPINGVEHNINNSARIKADKNIEFKGHSLLQNGELHTNADVVFNVKKIKLQKKIVRSENITVDLVEEFIQEAGADLNTNGNLNINSTSLKQLTLLSPCNIGGNITAHNIVAFNYENNVLKADGLIDLKFSNSVTLDKIINTKGSMDVGVSLLPNTVEKTLNITTQITVADKLKLAAKKITLSKDCVLKGKTIEITGDDLDLSQGKIEAEDDIIIDARNTTNIKYDLSRMTAGGKIHFKLKRAQDMHFMDKIIGSSVTYEIIGDDAGPIVIPASIDVVLKKDDKNIAKDLVIIAPNSNITIQGKETEQARVNVYGKADWKVKSVTVLNGGVYGHELEVNAKDGIKLGHIDTESGRFVTIEVNDDLPENRGKKAKLEFYPVTPGYLSSGKHMNLVTEKTIDSQGGEIQSLGTANFTAELLKNTGGVIKLDGDTDLSGVKKFEHKLLYKEVKGSSVIKNNPGWVADYGKWFPDPIPGNDAYYFTSSWVYQSSWETNRRIHSQINITPAPTYYNGGSYRKYRESSNHVHTRPSLLYIGGTVKMPGNMEMIGSSFYCTEDVTKLHIVTKSIEQCDKYGLIYIPGSKSP